MEALEDAVEELGHLEEYVRTMQPSKKDAISLAVGPCAILCPVCCECHLYGLRVLNRLPFLQISMWLMAFLANETNQNLSQTIFV